MLAYKSPEPYLQSRAQSTTWNGVDVDPVAVAEDLEARRPVHQQQRHDAVVAVRAAAQQSLQETGDGQACLSGRGVLCCNAAVANWQPASG